MFTITDLLEDFLYIFWIESNYFSVFFSEEPFWTGIFQACNTGSCESSLLQKLLLDKSVPWGDAFESLYFLLYFQEQESLKYRENGLDGCQNNPEAWAVNVYACSSRRPLTELRASPVPEASLPSPNKRPCRCLSILSHQFHSHQKFGNSIYLFELRNLQLMAYDSWIPCLFKAILTVLSNVSLNLRPFDLMASSDFPSVRVPLRSPDISRLSTATINKQNHAFLFHFIWTSVLFTSNRFVL